MTPHLLHASLTLAAVRMRRMRDRRRRGFRCITLEVSPTDAAVLVERGLLEHGDEGDLAAVERAIGAALERLAGYP